ncbi:Putative phage tail protein [Xanthomonas phage Suba]|uniref:Phage tail protein n=1 Tax=Xanthomonas phage Suba TaxID=2674975 RepID=A0A679K5Z7_9CAUD|nr:Putative phage tail protein [Xanthomonas phage Suba]CAA2409780.1 Putative phage tail protein [Xanthomonas phage Suba]
MIPEGTLSTKSVVSATADPVKQPGDFLVDWERAGKNLNDPSEGLLVKLWTLSVDTVDEVQQVKVSAPGVDEIVLFTGTEITEASLAFDQNMRPFVAFVQANQAKIYWYDSSVPGQITTVLPAGIKTPRCTTDEKREWHTAISDIVLSYIRAGNLCVRYQRERYQIEHVLKGVGSTAELVSVGVNAGGRLQFRCRKVSNIDSQFSVNADPYLADVVMALCLRSGISPERINVSELYDQAVIGYKINTKDGTNARIDALRKIFFFDKSERDGILFFPRRGREISARIPYVHLVADDPSALGVTLVQESELPAEVNVTHLDPEGGFANNKQTVRRKSNLVKTTKKIDVESEVVLTADQAATTALITSVSAWGEPQKFKFKTGLQYAELVAADTVEVEDKNGNWHIVRITERNEDRSVIGFEGVSDAQELYASLGVGRPLTPPVSTTPGLIGPTRIEILNIPCLRDQDDELGVYLGVCGESSGWYGSSILVATDGANFTEALTIETPATIGDTTTEMLAEISAEYPGNQAVEVLTNYPLESVSYENLLSGMNRCVIGDEVLQFQFANFLGMSGALYHYKLVGLVRGRYATGVEAWPQNTRFVLLDSSIAFMQAQQWMLGREIQIKPVSLGLTEDETIETEYDYSEGVSQREFPVTQVTATRDGSNNVSVAFVGRPRLGIETAPRNGKYFAGYRVKFSNGNTIDTFEMAASYPSAPAGISVQICALNSVTGEGPYSTPIMV